MAKEKVIPPDLTRKVEELFKLNKKTRKAAAAYEDAKNAEGDMRADLVALFGKKKLDGMRLKVGLVTMVESTYPVIDDAKKLAAYCKRKGNEDMLNAPAMNGAAWRARLDAGKVVPGVSLGKRVDLRVTPTKSK